MNNIGDVILGAYICSILLLMYHIIKTYNANKRRHKPANFKIGDHVHISVVIYDQLMSALKDKPEQLAYFLKAMPIETPMMVVDIYEDTITLANEIRIENNQYIDVFKNEISLNMSSAINDCNIWKAD